MHTKSIAVVLLGLLLVVSVGSAAASDGSLAVAVDQDDGGDVTVTVTHNESGVENASVENASVDVNTTDGNATYAGDGNYTTDENGTVELPAPDENVTVEVTADYDNETASTTAELVVAGDDGDEADAFGAEVSAFVKELLNGDEDQRRIGRLIAEFVVANNPGNAPDHAGPPDDRGPPSFAGDAGDGPAGNETRGHGNVTASSGEGHPGNGNGPPENPGSQGKGK